MKKINIKKYFFVFVLLFCSFIVGTLYVNAESLETVVDNNSADGLTIGNGDLEEFNATSTDEIIVRLTVITDEVLIFDGDILLDPCMASEGQNVATYSAYCLLNKANIDVVWNFDWGPAYLESISGIGNDYVLNKYWLYFKNLEYGFNSYDQEILQNGDSLLVENNIHPLKIATATTTPNYGTTTISVYEFGFDESWNGIWSSASSSNVYDSLGNIYETNSSGAVSIYIATTTPIKYFAKKNGFADSNQIEMMARQEAVSPEPILVLSGGGTTSSSHNKPDLEAMLSFLDSQQNGDGSFGADLYTDWVAIAYGSSDGHETTKDKLRNYLRTDSLDGTFATDYERRAMAMMALNLNPYKDGAENYIESLIKQFDGSQIGDPSLYNDDIFGIVVLLRLGYTEQDEIIKKSVEFILSKQEANGSWDGIDLTSASVQALSKIRQLPGVSDAIYKGIEYIKKSQNSDGGFGSSFGTSWAIQALASQYISIEEQISGSENPFDYLYMLQSIDGGIESIDLPKSNRIWATAYAISAVNKKIWYDILQSFNKEESNESKFSIGVDNIENLNSDLALTTINIIQEDSQLGVEEKPRIKGEVLGINNDDGEVLQSNTKETAVTNVILSEVNKSDRDVDNKGDFNDEFGATLILGGIGLIFYKQWVKK